MSLYVYITGPREEIECICNLCNYKHTRETQYFYSNNITYNLRNMAIAADIHDYIWYPESCHIIQARDLIEPLEEGLQLLLEYPDYFKTLNIKDEYKNLVQFVRSYVEACKKWPDAYVHTSA